MIDAESFQPRARWSWEEASRVHFTDTVLVGVCKPDFVLCIRGPDQHWEPFHPVGTQRLKYLLGNEGPSFVNASTLAVTQDGEMAVVTLTGALLFKDSLPKKFSFSRLTSSSSGERFACIVTRLRGNEALDMAFVTDDRIVVYDLGQQRAIYARKLRHGSPWIPPFEEHFNRAAISPNGMLLAILDEGMLEVYQLSAGQF